MPRTFWNFGEPQINQGSQIRIRYVRLIANGGNDLAIHTSDSSDCLPQRATATPKGDTREETEFAIAASGVEDYLLKDQVSGALLVEAINAALYRDKQQRGLMNLAYQVQRRAHWNFDRESPLCER